jgi:hypothetical protein
LSYFLNGVGHQYYDHCPHHADDLPSAFTAFDVVLAGNRERIIEDFAFGIGALPVEVGAIPPTNLPGELRLSATDSDGAANLPKVTIAQGNAC